jgi:hypothetical protein
VHSVPGEYRLLLPVVGTSISGTPRVLPLLTFWRDGRWEAAAGLQVTQTVILYVIYPLFIPFDDLVTEIRVERGYSQGTPESISPRSGRNRFRIPRVRPGVSPGYSPGTECTVGVGNYFDCHITVWFELSLWAPRVVNPTGLTSDWEGETKASI